MFPIDRLEDMLYIKIYYGNPLQMIECQEISLGGDTWTYGHIRAVLIRACPCWTEIGYVGVPCSPHGVWPASATRSSCACAPVQKKDEIHNKHYVAFCYCEQ